MRKTLFTIHNAVTDENVIVETVGFSFEIKIESQNGVCYPGRANSYDVNGISDETKREALQLTHLLGTRMTPVCANGHESYELHRLLNGKLLCSRCRDEYGVDNLWAFDQYNGPVPHQLMCISDLHHDSLNERQIHKIMQADWYEINNMLFVPWFSLWATIALCEIETYFEDICYDDIEEVLRVAECLKRYNREDGFYHA